MKIGMTELLVVFIVALFVIGPEKLPYYAKKLGEALGQFKRYSDEAARDVRESVVEPLKEAQEPFREAMEPLEELDRAVRGNVKEMKDSLNGLGEAKPGGKPKERESEREIPTGDGGKLSEKWEYQGENTSGMPEEPEIRKMPEEGVKTERDSGLKSENMSDNRENILHPDDLREMEELQRKMDELQKRMKELQGKEESV